MATVSSSSFQDIDHIEAVKGGASITFGNVLNQINKVIQTLINKFKNVDNDYKALSDRIGKGAHGDKKLTLDSSSNTTTKTEIIFKDDKNYYGHGFVKTSTLGYIQGDGMADIEGWQFIGEQRPNIKSGKITSSTNSVDGKSCDIGWVTLKLSHPNDHSTQLSIEYCSGGTLRFYRSDYTVQYELF